MRKTVNQWRAFYDPVSQQTFELDHLDAFSVNITQKPSKGKPAIIPCHITFSHHCFTDKLNPNKACDPDQIYKEPNKENRLFCKERYEVSVRYLRELVASSFSNGDTKCFKDEAYRLPYFLIKGVELNGKSVSYEVYFIINKSKTKGRSVSVLIDTAFIRGSRRLKRIQQKRMSIGVLANQKLKGN